MRKIGVFLCFDDVSLFEFLRHLGGKGGEFDLFYSFAYESDWSLAKKLFEFYGRLDEDEGEGEGGGVEWNWPKISLFLVNFTLLSSTPPPSPLIQTGP